VKYEINVLYGSGDVKLLELPEGEIISVDILADGRLVQRIHLIRPGETWTRAPALEAEQ